MKKLTTLALLASMSLTALSATIGYVNTQEVFRNYSQTKVIQTNLDKERTRLEGEVKSKELTLQKTQVELQSKGAKVTPEEKAKFQKDIEGFQKFVKDSQIKLNKEERARLQEIEAAINSAVQKVAKDGKYEYILEGGAVKFGGENVTTKVLEVMEKSVKK
ncbi:MAG: OmpH family outer membrane protein [Fusobacteriaceae bacterium]|nr:OmpH family outer membrane protein [Fusobacteriaceae bacterium]MBP6323005.1 OmpH family outer membrane protein [Fusobacteriaceae bacterium]MBP9509777.1 OmpH family outer membrane protein [Fusobacteriaceae bacterium]